jgi:hypothetical protein
MPFRYLILGLSAFGLLLVSVPLFGQAEDLLTTAPDGSTLLTPYNAYGVFMAKVKPPLPPRTMSYEEAARMTWPDKLNNPQVDDFTHHDLLQKYVAALKSVTERAAGISTVTVEWEVRYQTYDFAAHTFPINRGLSAEARDFPGIFVCFDEALPAVVPCSEDQAKAIYAVLQKNPQIVCRVKGALVAAIADKNYFKKQPGQIVFRPDQELDRWHLPCRLIIHPTSIEYRTKDLTDIVSKDGKFTPVVIQPSLPIATIALPLAPPPDKSPTGT